MDDTERITAYFFEFWRETDTEKVIKVKGTSMLPLIGQGDSISVKPVANPHELRIGDIALFRNHSGLIAHRIVDKFQKNDCLYLKEKGDQAFLPKVIPGSAVLGRVVKIHKHNTTINLENNLWTIINCAVGYYWGVLFVLFSVKSSIKARVPDTKRITFFSSVYKKFFHFLIKLPNLIFRIK